MKLPLLLLFLAATSATETLHHERSLQAASPLWKEEENRDSYVHFPTELKELLDEEFHTLMRSPEIKIFTTVPEPDQQLWPLVKGMTLRNHLDNKILWARPFYLITDGLEWGCRELVDGAEEHTPVESSLCEDHCIHQGRYCAPFRPAEMPAVLPAGFKGKEIVKESLRRVCADKYYHASDTKYFEYLEAFDRAECLQTTDVTQCALQAIEGIDHFEYKNFAECVAQETWDLDQPNEKLEEQLKEAKRDQATIDNMPQLHIGNALYQGEYTTKGIFAEYCSTFTERPMHPVSCDVCGGCADVRTCLWTLECDGVAFDPLAFLNSQPGQADLSDGAEATGATTSTTEAPAPVATLPPDSMTTASSTSTDNNDSTNESPYKEETQADNKTVIVFFSLAITVSALTAAFFVYRDRRTKVLMAEIQASSRIGDDEVYADYVDDSFRSTDDDLELSPSRNNYNTASGNAQPPKMAFLPEVA